MADEHRFERYFELDPEVRLALVRNPSPVLHASLALVLLLVATVLAVYKPLGLTRDTPRWVYFAAIVAIVTVAFVVLHFAGGGSGRH